MLAGLAAGSAVNWAVYALAWNRRRISPWQQAPAGAPKRPWTDRIPVAGWLGLRRESAVHGGAVWLRPMAVELLLGAGWAALYWWEVMRQGLVEPQFAALSDGPLPVGLLGAPAWTTLATFAAHAVLVAILAAASLIDLDEMTIPDAITIPGTLVALIIAAVSPMSLLPNVQIREARPPVGVQVRLPAGIDAGGARLFVEPTTPVAPRDGPARSSGVTSLPGLVVGLACYGGWCFALAPRIWRGRSRGFSIKLRVVLARALREMSRPPLLWLEIVGALGISAMWWRGGAGWIGLHTALVGLIGSGAMVWAVRVFGSAALRREALGFGDVTLMMMVGAMLGWQAGVIIFFLAPFAGLVVGAVQFILRRHDEIPYGPYLSLAAVALVAGWGRLWNADSWLQHVFAEPWLVPAVLAVGVLMLWAMLVLWRNFKETMFRATA
ncbi:MAG TPA: A24 family peptidase [Lacipirellulaceae bacterium]|nr:A24 family peptidase [Lacipirellulaceae bacterium]